MGFVLIVSEYLRIKKKGNYAICTSPQCFRLIRSGVKLHTQPYYYALPYITLHSLYTNGLLKANRMNKSFQIYILLYTINRALALYCQSMKFHTNLPIHKAAKPISLLKINVLNSQFSCCTDSISIKPAVTNNRQIQNKKYCLICFPIITLLIALMHLITSMQRKVYL